MRGWRRASGDCSRGADFKSAVSQISKSAKLRRLNGCPGFSALPIWKSAIQQVGKPALRGG